MEKNRTWCKNISSFESHISSFESQISSFQNSLSSTIRREQEGNPVLLLSKPTSLTSSSYGHENKLGSLNHILNS